MGREREREWRTERERERRKRETRYNDREEKRRERKCLWDVVRREDVEGRERENRKTGLRLSSWDRSFDFDDAPNFWPRGEPTTHPPTHT